MSTQTEMPQGTTTFKLHRRDLNALLQFLAVETTYEDDTNEFITRTHIYDIDPGQAAEGLFRTKHALTVITNAVTDMEAQLNQSKPPTTEQTPRSAA